MTKSELAAKDRCDLRYPVPGPRAEPFEVTYRCQLPLNHEGPCGAVAYGNSLPDYYTDSEAVPIMRRRIEEQNTELRALQQQLASAQDLIRTRDLELLKLAEQLVSARAQVIAEVKALPRIAIVHGSSGNKYTGDQSSRLTAWPAKVGEYLKLSELDALQPDPSLALAVLTLDAREQALDIAFEQGYLCNRPGYSGGSRVAAWSNDIQQFRERSERLTEARRLLQLESPR